MVQVHRVIDQRFLVSHSIILFTSTVRLNEPLAVFGLYAMGGRSLRRTATASFAECIADRLGYVEAATCRMENTLQYAVLLAEQQNGYVLRSAPPGLNADRGSGFEVETAN